MGRGICIIEPAVPKAVLGRQELARALTPNPKEAATTDQTGSIALDFGTAVTFDTAYMGYHTATAGQQWSVVTTDAAGANTGVLMPAQIIAAPGYGPPYHGFSQGAPLTSRYWRIDTNNGPSNVPFQIGVIALGSAFQTEYGEERGGGGIIEDTGTVERLFGGGFGIDEGVATTGYQWVFGDLQDAERRQLFQIVKRLRTTRSFLMVENPAQTEGLNERIHWGNLRKLEAYERIDPRNSKWALSMWDWG